MGKVLAVDDDGDDVVYQFADDFPKVNISSILLTASDFFVKGSDLWQDGEGAQNIQFVSP